MTTFRLETCNRLVELLWEKCPETLLYLDRQGNLSLNAFGSSLKSPTGLETSDYVPYDPAFTLQDMTADVWKALGEKLGWKNKNSIIWGVEPDWWSHAFHCYEAFLEGGMEAADSYLYDIIK